MERGFISLIFLLLLFIYSSHSLRAFSSASLVIFNLSGIDLIFIFFNNKFNSVLNDNSLSFTYDYPVAVGDIYLGKTVTKLYTGYDTTKYNSASAVPWYADGNYDDIVRVTFLETTTPTSTAFWFSSFKNVESIDLEKLDTSGVTKMSSMFAGCERLVTLNVDMFQTSNVIDMDSMFEGCQNIIELDLSCFNTSNVTAMNKPGRFSYGGMFRDCRSLNSLDISSFDTSKL